jgi:hypothetical protein
MKRALTALALVLCLFSASTVNAADAATEAALAADPVAEKRLQEIASEQMIEPANVDVMFAQGEGGQNA